MFRWLFSRNAVSHCLRRLSIPRDMKYDQGPSFYVIPEIPKETSLGQKLAFVNGIPNLNEVTPELAFNGFSRLLIDHQLCLSKLSEQLKKTDTSSLSVHTVLNQLKEIFQPVEQSFEALSSISLYSNDPMWALINGRLFQKLKTSRVEYFCLDPDIYRALLNFSHNASNLDRTEKALLEAIIYECWKQGADFTLTSHGRSARSHLDLPTSGNRSPSEQPDLDRIRTLYGDLHREEEQFQAMIMAASSMTGAHALRSRLSGRLPDPSDLTLVTGASNVPIAESDLAPSTPSWLPSALGGRVSGGHVADMRINLASDPVVQAVLKHCSTRQVRHVVWYGWVQRSSLRAFGGSTGQHGANDGRMQTIRRARHRLANSLGCEDWLSVIWRGTHLRSPTSPEALIQDYLEPLRTVLQPLGKQELQLLTEWASSNLDLRGAKLDAWDIDYAIEQYNYAATYGQLQAILIPTGGNVVHYIGSLLDQLASLFQLRVIPDPTGSDSELVDVVRFQIEDSQTNSILGHVILDVFAKQDRPVLLGKSVTVPLIRNWGTTGSKLTTVSDSQPIVALLSDLPLTARKEGVKVQDLLSIASGFGACLHRILPCAHYHQPTGISPCLAPDTRYLVPDLCSTLMFTYVLRPRLSSIAKEPSNSNHFYTDPKTGIRPPPGRIVVLPMLRQLYEARFDLSLWSRKDRHRNWMVLSEEHWASHLPYARHPDDFWPCSATQLFGPNSEAGLQYQHVWRQLILQDVLSALEEHGWPDQTNKDAVQKVLQRFRDTFLVAKDLLPPAELFRAFRGRDVSSDALIHSIRNRLYVAPSPVLLGTDAATTLVRE